MMTATPGVMTLTIPAASEHVRFARLLAGGLAAQCNFNVDEVEDIRIAVDEGCHALIGDRSGVGSIVVTCAVDDGTLRVEAWADTELSANRAPEYADLSEAILDAVVDSHELLIRDGQLGFVVTKRGMHG